MGKQGKAKTTSTLPDGPSEAKAADPNALTVVAKEGEEPAVTIAKKLIDPRVSSALTTREFSPLLKQSALNDVVEAMSEQVGYVQDGDLSRPEAILAAQAHTLDAMFNTLAQKASANMGSGYLQATESYLRMALKAQSQCRTTLEALAEIKCPRTPTFIRQQNVANQQQVNNGQPAHAHEKDITPANELLMESKHATLDAGGAGAAIGINSKLEAVGAVHRAD